MSHCTGAPAEQLAEQYVAGTLSDSESRAFEEHYFDCPVCLAQLQALEAVALQIHRNPVKIPGRVIAWPAIVGAIGAIAALLLIAVIGYRDFARRAANAKNPGASSSPVEKSKPSSTSAISQLADLSLPPFEVSSLRGEGVNRNFSAGMKAYASGDCAAAVRELARVPAGSADALTAQLYSGVCQMKLNQLAAAATILDGVVGKGDSPQQEAALYYRAQIALLRSDAAGARHNLEMVVSLHGDFEERARTELSKLPADRSEN